VGGGVAMRITSIKHLIQKENDQRPEKWFDEELDNDGLDLQEWAFMQGYYGEV